MGLDMYLLQECSEQDRDGLWSDVEGSVPLKQAAYWRKANQIHAWFVREVQNDVDECQLSEPFGADRLGELHWLCKLLLDSKDEAKAGVLLPPQSGFFFGSTELNEWYWKDLEATVEQLEPHLYSEARYRYQSSW